MLFIRTVVFFQVADLRIELKQRGLSTTGNKNELVERLQLAIHGGTIFTLFQFLHSTRISCANVVKGEFYLVDSTLSLDETTEEILDEDEVLGVSVPFKRNDINWFCIGLYWTIER